MKGYKATYNMKCRDQLYEVGYTYESDKLEVCKHGFHFCRNMEDVVMYYTHDEDFILLEVESIGNTIEEKDKCVTDKMKIIRIVPPEEYTFKQSTWTLDDNGNVSTITYPCGVKYQYEYDESGNRISCYHIENSSNPIENSSNPKTLPYRRYIKEYDKHNRVIRCIFYSGIWFGDYVYDDRGNLKGIINGNKQITQEFNDKNQIIKATYDDGGVEIYEPSNITVTKS